MPKIDFVIQKFPNTIYNTESGNLYDILSSLSKELDIFLQEMDKVKKSHFIDDATGPDLDKIGAILNLRRFSNESDLSFRGRIKTAVPSFIGGGTISSIKQVIRTFLGVDATIVEHYKPDNGHALFNNGVLNGFSVVINSGLELKIKSGTSYIKGTRITLDQAELTVEDDSIQYIKLSYDGIFAEDNDIVDEDTILLAKIETNDGEITKIDDLRFILDPFEHYVTNIASVTIQIPYNFTESLITVSDVKNVIKKTRAAGVAVLISVVGAYQDSLKIREVVDFGFLVGLSNVGSSNYFGGP